MSDQEGQSQVSGTANALGDKDFAGGRAALAEANRHNDILLTSLGGVGAIVIVLLFGLALPVFDHKPITSFGIFIIMVLASMAGIGELCFINYRVHRHVTTQARLTEVLLNSLGQGFLSFDSKGVCGRVYSQVCLELLEIAPANMNIVNVLRLQDPERSDFKDWIDMLFAPNHALSFEDVVKFLPQTYAHSGGRQIKLEYRAVRDSNEDLLSVVLIATDQTEEAEAQLRARIQQNYVNMISRIFKERNQFLITITHIRKFIDEAKQTSADADAPGLLRLLHTLKAAAAHFHLDTLGHVIHDLEAALRSPPSNEDFQLRLVKGGAEIESCLQNVLDQVGDLIGQDYEGRGNMHEVEENAVYDFAKVMRDNKVDPKIIERYLHDIVAIPLNETFSQFERELKDLGEIMGKKIKPLQYSGTNPRVLARPMEGFLLSLMHICRNIVDHGIEPAVTRLARGKDPSGTVLIHSALIAGDNGAPVLQIEISDDGNGIDPALVRAKLASIDPGGIWQRDDDQAVIQRILLWEVSTRNNVTDLSGRGVGMEAVDREIRLLGGTIMVYSQLYHGTRFDIRIPYNLNLP